MLKTERMIVLFQIIDTTWWLNVLSFRAEAVGAVT